MNSNNKSIEDVLRDGLSSDRLLLQTTTETLTKMAKIDLSDFLTKLGEIIYSEGKDKPLRQLAAIVFKNILIRDTENTDTYLNKISKENKQNIRNLILGSLASEQKEIRTISSNLIATICKVEQPIEKNWPELLSALTDNCFNQNLNIKLSAIETLGYVCEEMNLKDISDQSLYKILTALVGNIKENNNNLNVIQYSLRAFTSCIKFSEGYFSKENERKIIMESIFTIIKSYSNNMEILDKVAILFIEMFSRSNFYDYVEPFILQIFEFSFYLIKKNGENERVALLGLEIICTLGDEEEKREMNVPIYDPNKIFNEMNNYKKQSKKYFDKISIDLQKMIIQYVQIENGDDEEESEWNLSKGCLYVLSLLVKVCELQNISTFFKELEEEIKKNNSDIKQRCKYWLLLSSSICTKYKDKAFKLILSYINPILGDIENKNSQILQTCASFLLKKATSIFPKVIDIYKIESTFKILLSTLQNCNSKTGINICQSLQNIINCYGDSQTKKSSNNLSQYFNMLINGLFVTVEGELINPKDNYGKFSLARLMTMDTIISNTSHDKQEALIEILIKYLQQIEFTHTYYGNLIEKGIKEEKIKQLQDFYYTLLSCIFKKYQKPIPSSIANNIWILTEQIFKLRKSVFEEANIALSALATNMKEGFIEIFKLYYPFLEFSVKKFDENNLSRSGLATLLAIIRVIGKDIVPLSKNILKLMISVCTSNDVTRQNKTIAISCIGEIAINLGTSFSEYLNDIMILLLSACQLSITGTDDDEDSIQFIKELRYEIIQTFTCIEFALEDKINLFIPHVPNIFEFFKKIVNDQKYMREDILFSMMNFVCDMINIFGVEMKPLCNKEFVVALITNLKSYNIESYKDEITKSENLIQLLFNS